MLKFISRIRKNIHTDLLIILLAGLVFRLLLTPFGTLELDHGTFVAWSRNVSQNGFTTFYQGWSDYLPGYVYVLWLLGKISESLPISTYVLYKIPAILADVTTAYLIYHIVKKIKSVKAGLLAGAIYLFNPAILANSSLWGQVDSLTALFSLASVYFASVNPLLSALFLSIGTAVKPQAALTAIVILFIAYKNKWSIPKLVLYVVLSGVIWGLVFVPFSGGENIFEFIQTRLNVTLTQYKYTSVNAFNFWGLSGMWNADTWQNAFGMVVTGVISFLAAFKLRKVKNGEYLLLSFILLTGFMFMTRLHERHMLPVLAPLTVSLVLYPSLSIPYVILSFTYVANLYYAFIWITEDFKTIFSPTTLVFLILLNAVSYLYLLLTLAKNRDLLRLTQLKRLFKKGEEKEVKLKETIPQKRISRYLALVLAFAFITRIFMIQAPHNEYFDEVYHAFTARTMYQNDPKAWEWWNPHPEGFAYEWTHPPLAKLGMWLGMTILGENSLGWRIPQVLLGTASVFLIYLIASTLFKSREVGLFASAIFALDGLPLTMSRIGMNDTYLLFFMLLAFYLYIKDKYFWSAFALGLAAGSKWSIMWFAPILLASHFSLRKKITPRYAWFIILPPLLYLASYIPFFTSGHSFNQFVELQKQMWWYHTNLVATHAYSSPWWSWPLSLRPVWAYVSYESENFVRNIYLMGNPILAWSGLVLLVIAIYYAIKERNKKLGLLVFGYLAFFVSWAISPRIMFYYHYLPSFAFMSMILGYVVKRHKEIVIPLLLVCLVAFLYFYPHWTGMLVPTWLNSSYYWFSTWR